jgi:alpha-maltose-1-phosphate synthase
MALRVVTSHPAKQVAVYDISAQLAARGQLAAHLAATYYVPDRFPYRLAPSIGGDAGRDLTRQLMKRRFRALPDDLVVDWPWVELTTRALQRVPVFNSLLAYREPYRLVEAAHDLHAASWLRRHPDTDVVMPYHGAALRTLRVARAMGIPSVLSVIHPMSSDRIVAEEYQKLGRPERLRPTAKRLWRELELADYCLTPSPMTTRSLLEAGVPPERIKEVLWGVDMNRAAPLSEHEPSSQVRFLFVGKLSVHKGLHVLREAWARITNPNVTLTIVGEPIRPFEAELMREWTARHDPRVRTIPEAKPDIRAVYRQADIFVFPSLVEGFGMVTLEAMGSGLPVIVTEGSKAVVRDGIDGFVLKPGDVDGLVHCMTRLADNAALRTELGRNAHEQARRYSWTRFGDELSEWLRSIGARAGDVVGAGAQARHVRT